MKSIERVLTISIFLVLTFATEEQNIDEIVIDEVVDDHIKQKILIDRNYNSSFTISVPMMSVVVPGTATANGIVRFSISHLTLWSLISISFAGLVYPIFLGPHGKLHRSFGERQAAEPNFFDHLDSVLNVTQLYNDITTILPENSTQHCKHRAFCEIYEHADEFGLFGLILRTAYLPSGFSLIGNKLDDDFRDAAFKGIFSSKTCEKLFSGCIVSPVETYLTIRDYVLDNFF